MKTIRLFGIALLTVLMSVSFSACGGSDDDVDNGGKSETPTISEKHLSQWVNNDSNGESFEFNFIYDSQYKVIELTVKGINNSYRDKYTYTYTGNSVSVNNGRYKYTLSNGLIMWRDGGFSYSYDQNGYIISESQNGITTSYTWSGGNLSEITEVHSNGSESITNYEYTNLTWPKNLIIASDSYNIWGPLSPLGYWGKTPKNLPKRIVQIENGNVVEDATVEYTMKDGYPVKTISSSSNGTTISTFEWN